MNNSKIILNACEMSGRNPYPFPRIENDEQFVGLKKEPHFSCQDTACNEKNPWSRLNETKTLSSERREVYHYDPQSPRDSLDFVLKCQYDHHQQFMKMKADTLVQPETLGVGDRILTNRPIIPEPVTLKSKPLVDFTERRKTLIHSAKGLAIESHHSEATNRGYSRKHDGGFYST